MSVYQNGIFHSENMIVLSLVKSIDDNTTKLNLSSLFIQLMLFSESQTRNHKQLLNLILI